MNNEWKWKKLKELSLTFIDGNWIESKDQSTEGIRLIQTGNIGDGFFKDRGEKARFISDETFKELKCIEVIAGDCLISRLPTPVGRSCIIPPMSNRAITAVDCTIVRFKQDEIIPAFFIYYSQSNEYNFAIDSETTGTTRKRISRSKLGEIPIPLPPLEEQQRIVAWLDEAFAAIDRAVANTQQNLLNARAMFESHLHAIFAHPAPGWKTLPLGDVCSIVNGGTPDTSKKEYWGKDIFWITPKDMGKLQTEYVDNTERKISQKGLLNSSAKILPKNAIILSSRAPIGYVAITNVEITTNQGCKGLIPSDEVDPKLLYFFLKKSGKLLNDLGHGTTFKELSSKKLAEVLIPLPPLEEQQQIVQKLTKLSEEMRNLVSLYQQKLADLAELKQALLHQALTPPPA